MSATETVVIGRFGPNREAGALYRLLVEKLPNHSFREGNRIILDTGKIAEDMGIKNKQTVASWTKSNTIPANRLHRFTSLNGSKLKEGELLPFITRR